MQHPIPGADQDPSTAPPPVPNRRPGASTWILATMAALLLGIGGIGGAVALTRGDSRSHPAATPVPRAADATATGVPAPATTTVCRYLPSSDVPSGARPATTPTNRPHLPRQPQIAITTGQGVIAVDLAANAAPCTVNSFLSLVHAGFYNRTHCHRLTTDTIYVLQCGDPGKDGQGGPGYRFDDENLPITSKPAYPRGTVAMANAGPGTNGSQFFLVYRDSDIDPNYSVFGTITAGLDVLDRIAAGGADDSNSPGDGHPRLDVTISKVSWAD
jgi:peptidyl-prolyl cis-trans isomerase B (cyclophilin B)